MGGNNVATEQPKNSFKNGAIGCLALIMLSLILGLVISAIRSDKNTDTNPTNQTQNQEQTYTNFIVNHSGKVTDTLINLSQLMEDPKIEDQDWATKTATSLILLNELADQAINYTSVPEKFTKIHDTYLKAMKEIKYASEQLPTAIDKRDKNAMTELSSHIEKAGEYMNSATGMVKQLGQ